MQSKITTKQIPVVFPNGSAYDYHFIFKDFAEEFKGKFECLRENTEKYITFSVPIKKELDNDKTKFIDSLRFMSSSLSSLADNLPERIFNDKSINCNPCLDYILVKDDQLIFRCFGCKKK